MSAQVGPTACCEASAWIDIAAGGDRHDAAVNRQPGRAGSQSDTSASRTLRGTGSWSYAPGAVGPGPLSGTVAGVATGTPQPGPRRRPHPRKPGCNDPMGCGPSRNWTAIGPPSQLLPPRRARRRPACRGAPPPRARLHAAGHLARAEGSTEGFPPDRRRSDGLHSWCRACGAEANRRWRTPATAKRSTPPAAGRSHAPYEW